MSWRDNLRPAKLGSASFFVDGADAQLGRNVKVFEYPLRDKPYVEDLGRKARRITLEAYVLASASTNNDYMPARDALMREIELGGIKTLVHPYLGELKVTLSEATGPRESTREGGMARFTLTLIESGEQLFPAIVTDTQGGVASAADKASAAQELAFVDTFNVAHLPAYVSTSAADQVRAFADKLNTITRRVTTLPTTMTDFVSALSELSGAVSSLILAPQTLVSRISALFAQLTSIANEPSGALEITRSLFDYGDDVTALPPAVTPSRAQQAANQAALIEVIEQAAVVTAARIAAQMDFDSSDDALGVRDELIAAIDAMLETSSSDDVYFALVDVRTAMVADIETRAAQLAKLLKVNLPVSVPAVVLAYSLYGEASRDAEVIKRNAIRNPNFVPSGRDLEVLADG